ncbi:c-type cytochrome [Sorangium sp. So ce131]|uniref:c-type cytochrome n=1 Tax=Sorangium sp. So ce131 TaxID=3133282 RepID=UPI003F5F337D
MGVSLIVFPFFAAPSLFAACIDSGADHGPGEAVVAQPAAAPPPAISGGTLAVSGDGLTAVAADPDRDRVWIVALKERKLRAEIALKTGDEPGRVVEDGAGRFHVALRRGGAVVTLDAERGALVDRRVVCPAPRGITYDAGADALHVACLGGELVTLPAGGGAATRRLQLQRDLRDVVVRGERLLVSTFRSAELLSVNADGTIDERAQLPGFDSGEQQFKPNVAWRMVKTPADEVFVVHQRAMLSPVVIGTEPEPTPGEPVSGYNNSGVCEGGVVQSTVSRIGASTALDVPQRGAPALASAPLPVDIAVSAELQAGAIVSAGMREIVLLPLADFFRTEDAGDSGEDPGAGPDPGAADPRECVGGPRLPVDGQPIAAAFAGSSLVVQSREPARLVVFEIPDGWRPGVGDPGRSFEVRAIDLPGQSARSAGHEMFHTNERGPMVCASCHPEGGDDGHTWSFDPIGPRRTQVVSGGILKTAPFHWDGDMFDLTEIMTEVFEGRMGGRRQSPTRVAQFAAWIDALPAPPASPAPDAEAAARGEALFHDETVGCARCHAGARLTSDAPFDVGTGKRFQVPSLFRVGSRAPYMHDGCAATLKDRFVDPSCGGGDLHGKTSHLSDAQIDDLVAYLETL